MTREEAEKIARIFETADGGDCLSCMDGLCREANEAQLGFRWVILDEDAGWDTDKYISVVEA